MYHIFCRSKDTKLSIIALYVLFIIMGVTSIKESLPIMRQFATFNDYHNLTFVEKWGVSDIHVVDRQKFVCELDIDFYKQFIFLDDSMKLVPDCQDMDQRLSILYNQITKYSTHFCTLWGMFVCYDTSLAYDDRGYRSFGWGGGSFPRGPLSGSVDEIIVIGTFYSQNSYGHMITDFFTTLMLVPQEIQQRAKILAPNLRDGHDILTAFGFREDQFVHLKYRTWIFANIVYTVVENSPASYFYANLTQALHNRLMQAYNLEDVQPTNYFYCNRQYRARRYIHNMKEIIEETSKLYPEIHFINLTDMLPSVRETATKWASAKLIYLPSGSNALKEVFMKPYSVLVMPTSLHGDYTPLRYAASNLVFILQYTTCLDHYVGPGCAIDLNLSIINLGRGIYCAKNGKWPS